MNWKRGLLRLWVVAAVLWVAVAFYSENPIQKVFDVYAQSDWVNFTPEQQEALANAKARVVRADLLDFSVSAFIPPLLLLALGYIGLWVGRGFRK
jgi:hypothetical protein